MQITITIDDDNPVDSGDTPWTSNLTVTIDSGRVTEVAQGGIGADPIEALHNQLAEISDDDDLVWLKRLYLNAVKEIQGPAAAMTKQAAELTAADDLFGEHDPADSIATTVDEAIDHVSGPLSQDVSPEEFTITTINGIGDRPATDTYFADFNGYDATGGERLLEGVTFRVELTETSDSFEVTSVAPVPDAMPYLANIRWEKFAEVIKGLAELNLAHLATCAAQQHTTLKAMFDEFATESGENGGQLLAEV